MANQTNGKIVDNFEEGREVEDVLGHAVGSTGGPSAVAVSAQVEREDVIAFAQDPRDPIPVASVVQSAVNQNQRRLAVLAIVPELQLEAVGIEEVRDGFHRALFGELDD